MKMSEQIDQLATAMAAAQGEMKNPPCNKRNPHFKSKYADLPATLDQARDVLAKHGLAVIQWPSADGAKLSMHTLITHKSGQWLEPDPCSTRARDDAPQSIGSAVTYLRRYTFGGLVALAPDEDDDAETAEGRDGPPREQRPPPPPRDLPPPVKGDGPVYTGDDEAQNKKIMAYLTFQGIDESLWGELDAMMRGRLEAELGSMIKLLIPDWVARPVPPKAGAAKPAATQAKPTAAAKRDPGLDDIPF